MSIWLSCSVLVLLSDLDGTVAPKFRIIVGTAVRLVESAYAEVAEAHPFHSSSCKRATLVRRTFGALIVFADCLLCASP